MQSVTPLPVPTVPPASANYFDYMWRNATGSHFGENVGGTFVNTNLAGVAGAVGLPIVDSVGSIGIGLIFVCFLGIFLIRGTYYTAIAISLMIMGATVAYFLGSWNAAIIAGLVVMIIALAYGLLTRAQRST